MSGYKIIDAKVGASSGGIACGPVGGTVVASVLYEAPDGERKWLHCCEAEGLPAFYLSEDDIHGKLLEEDWEDQAFWDRVNCELFVDSFDGLPLGEYEKTLKGLAGESPAAPLIRFLIALTRCDWKDAESLIDGAKGKYAQEIKPTEIDI